MKHTVLFVDDDFRILQAFVRKMRKEPFRVHTATSAEEALGALERARVDLIVSDLRLPGMSGTEFLARVAREYPDCVRIMLTGQPNLSVAMEAINSGSVYKFLIKPVDAEDLATIIRVALSQRPAAEKLAKVGSHGRVPAPAGVSSDMTPPDAQIGLRTERVLDQAATASRVSHAVSHFSREFFESLGKPGFKAHLQQFDLQGVIGQGNMGIVVKAHDTSLHRDVALKFMAPDWSEHQVAHQRFAVEARCAAAIRHENVVTIFAVSAVNGLPYLVMEYVPGKSLQDFLDAEEPFEPAEIVRIGRQIALGLAAAHELRIIHRDIKPGNILVENGTRRVRISDFGLARALDGESNLSQKGLLLGTPSFMSPEQVDGRPLTHASDLFSLGSVLYTLCTGRYPFASSSLTRLLRAIAEEMPPPVREVNPAVPESLAHVIAKLHAKQSEERFPSAAAVAEQLR